LANKPIFIVGNGRSGTSLLRLMLHHHPRIAIPYESHFITKYHKNILEYGDLKQHDNLLKLLNDILEEPYIKLWDHSFDIQNIIQNIKNYSLQGVFSSIYENYARSKGKQRWGDKSGYLESMHIINEIFPDAQFIHIIRDGRDVASSIMKMSWGPDDIIEAAEWWNLYILLGRRMGSILGKKRYAEVYFEELVQQPEKELRKLCSFLEEEYYPQMLDYHRSNEKSIPASTKQIHYNIESKPMKSRTFAWKSEMTSYDVAIFNRYAGKMLAETNYEIPEIKISDLQISLRIFLIYIKRFLRRTFKRLA
jgi:hypothetical protein